MLSNLIYYFKQPHSRVLGFLFFSMSILFGSWVARIPEVQNKLELNDSSMGLAILFMGIGSFIMSPLAGYIFTKISVSKALMIGSMAMALTLAPLALASSLLQLCFALFLFGLSQGFLNIALNTTASAIEKESCRTIMSTCHGMFSIGAMVGVALGSLLVGFEMISLLHFLGIGLVVVMIVLFNAKQIKTLPKSKVEVSRFALPPKILWALTFIGLCAMLAEGVVANWSGNFMKNSLQANDFLLGLGFAGFSGCMAIGRLFGDEIIPKVGAQKMLLLCLLLGSLGLGIVSISNSPELALVGFSLSGLGFSVVVPMIFSAAGQTPNIAPSHAIAAVAGIGILGFLGGPPLIGVIADYTSMRMGMIITTGVTVLAFILAFFRK